MRPFPAALYYRLTRRKVGPAALYYRLTRRTARRVLRGVTYRRHLLWRYSLRWRKPL